MKQPGLTSSKVYEENHKGDPKYSKQPYKGRPFRHEALAEFAQTGFCTRRKSQVWDSFKPALVCCWTVVKPTVASAWSRVASVQ